MTAPVPMVEVTYDTDALGIGRPDGKAGALRAVNGAQLCPQLFVNTPLVAFAKQKQVGFA